MGMTWGAFKRIPSVWEEHFQKYNAHVLAISGALMLTLAGTPCLVLSVATTLVNNTLWRKPSVPRVKPLPYTAFSLRWLWHLQCKACKNENANLISVPHACASFK